MVDFRRNRAEQDLNSTETWSASEDVETLDDIESARMPEVDRRKEVYERRSKEAQ